VALTLTRTRLDNGGGGGGPAPGIVTQYGLNGVDIDYEGSSLSLNAGDLDFRAPTSRR
jgi:hypothetical protein